MPDSQEPVLRRPESLSDYRQILRMTLRDEPKTNKLLLDYEMVDKELDTAIMKTLDDFNSSPPLIGAYTLNNFPAVRLLIDGAVIQCLRAIILNKFRDHIQYTDQGFSVNDDAQGQEYMSYMAFLTQEYNLAKKELKRALNLAECYGGIPSAYANIYPLL